MHDKTKPAGSGDSTAGQRQYTHANATPEPDKAAILETLRALFEPTDVIELRAFHKGGRKRTDAGYFDGDHRDALADAAVRLNTKGAAVYVTLNRIDPQLLGRYCNRVEEFAQSTATDANVTRRRWLLIDFDPVRPKDTAATDAQVAAAKDRALAAYRMLEAEGWPAPIVAESGNGYHLLYPLDFPNDDEARELAKGALEGLAAQFDDDAVKVDTSVFNAGRITKLYGTVATKGDHTAIAPWRLSRLLKAPVRGVTVTPEQLRVLRPRPAQLAPRERRGDFDLIDFLARLGIHYEHDVHEGRDRYRLAHCPFNPEHGKGEAAIFRAADGRLGFKCQHASCAGKDWHAVRELVDGSRREGVAGARSRAQSPGTGEHGSGAASGPAGECWLVPLPLTVRIEPEPYPADALPGLIGAAVAEVQAFVQAPLPLVACSALSALSVAIQAHYDAKRADRLQGPVSLFTLAIADSGERKTTVDGFFTSTIREWEADQAVAAEPAQRQHGADAAAWKAKREALLDLIKQEAKKGAATTKREDELRGLEAKEPKPPRVPRVLLGDETPENLAFTLARRWPSGGVISSEAGIVFGAHGMQRENIMRNLALLNVLWDGGTLSVGRRTSESFTVRGARLTVALQIQEATLREFFAQSRGLARGTGFLARFLIAWPASTQGQRPFREAPPRWPALAAFNDRLEALLKTAAPVNEAGELAPQLLELAPDAKAAWICFHNDVEAELRDGGELADVKDVASKAADNAARLAALFHVFEGGAGPVSLSAFGSASRVVAWHLSESRRFFGELALPAELADAGRLDEWLIAYCRRERVASVPMSAIQKSGPGRLREKAKLEPALAELADLGRVRLIRDGRAKTIDINPALLSEGGAP